MNTTQTFPARFGSVEEWREYRRAVNARYHRSEKGLAAMKRSNESPVAKARYARYRKTEKYRASQQRRKESDAWKAYQAAHLKAYRLAHPEIHAAHGAIAEAVRRGLARPSACQCGRGGRLHAHHHRGYAIEHWLDVIWLCPKCHKAAHAPTSS